jgi:hypothetical protein
MSKRLCFWVLACSAVATATGRPELSGTWQHKSETMEIQQKEDSIQITYGTTDPDSKEKKLEIRCNTAGKECKLKEEQVSLWYNSGMLVMMEMRRGNEVVIKKRLKPSEDGKTLNVEVIHITPPGESENVAFTRLDDVKASQ